MTKKKDVILGKDKLKNIKKSIKILPKEKQDVANSLLDEAMFCTDTLMELKKIVIADGVITEMEQGDYSIMRENPALKSYNSTIKNYQNLMKLLSDLFANIPVEEKPDELEEFCK